METKPRNRLDIEGDFIQSFGIVSCLSDLLTTLQCDRFDELDQRAVDQANFAIHQEAQKLHSLFYELLEKNIQNK